MKMPAILRSHLLVALLIVLGLGLWALRPFLLDPYQQIDDVRNLHAVHQLLDPELFPHRVTNSLTLAETSAAYFTVLAFLSRLVTPLLASKVLGLLLLLIGAAYTYRLVSLLARPPTALIATIGFAVFNLSAESEISAIGGLQRSFFTPLLLALLYYLHRGRYLAAATVVLLSGLFYAPSLLVVALTYALTAVRQRPAAQASIAGRWGPMLFLLLALVIVFGMQFQLVLDRLGTIQEATLEPPVSSTHILQDATYTAGGRRQLFIIFPIVGRGGFVSNTPAALQLTLLGILALLARVLLGERAALLPRAALQLL